MTLKRLTYLLLAFYLIHPFKAMAQQPNFRNFSRVGQNLRSLKGAGGGSDSLHHRNRNEDSITIFDRYLDSSKRYKLDSSVNDFTTRYPIPATNTYLGNLGTASRPILFNPNLTAGWDPGFHALDIYKWNPASIMFFNTTRPYTELTYLLGSKTEQILGVIHTQNIKPNWNFSFRYSLINSPGFFQSQNSNHNNLLLTSWYEGKKKRYNNYFFVLGNHLQVAENGGIKNDTDYLANNLVFIYKDRFSIPTNLDSGVTYSKNFFSTNIKTGNRYREFTVLMRQQYDLGKKDSLVTDSTVIPLFYPRVRFEHTISFMGAKYQYFDYNTLTETSAQFYNTNYAMSISPGDTVYLRDRWKDLVNDLSIYQFPDAKNLQQFVKLGAAFQMLKGEFTGGNSSFYNLILHGEYRNTTRNKKWDVELFGSLYSAGFNSGNYDAHISLKRFVGKKKQGYAEIGFENVNRSPSFLFDSRSSFYLDKSLTSGFNKENNSHIFASIYQPALKLRLSGDYYLISNYTYFTSYYKLRQYEPLFNFLLISAQKVFRLSRHFNWYADVYIQQKTGDVPLNVPFLFTRNRIAYEGSFFRNLNISTGVEIKYQTPYKADGYSPVVGQFFYQDSVTISNKPDIAAFLQFRIRGFKAFIRAENLNTAEFIPNQGFGWTNNNLAASGYPYPGLQIRVGIWWSFVN